MRKIIYLLMVVGLVFTSACNPMDDIYEDLDAEGAAPILGEDVYTLTDDDYADLGVPNGFNTADEAKSLLPDFLAGLYPVWGKDSSVLVDYKMADGASNLDEVNEFANAESYNLKNEDYPGAADNAIGFFPNEDPSDFLGDILEANIADPAEGDIVLATYKQYVGEVESGLSDYYEASFNGSLGDFEVINVLGSNEWLADSYGDYEYAKMSAYKDGQNEDWLISPAIDLTNQTNASFQINQTAPFIGGDWSLISVLVSTNYTTGGDHTAATWETITIEDLPTGADYDYDYVLSELVDLSAYDGQMIHVAFKYLATDAISPTWQIDFAVIKVPGVEGDTDSRGMYMIYNSEGEWEDAGGVYYMSTSDYDSMGTASGQPGKYNNFDNSMNPNNYIPTLLSKNYPYAQEEDLLIVMYKFYAGETTVKGNAFSVMEGMWKGSAPSLQFGHDGSAWVPDNTIKYTLTGADYALTGDDKYSNYYVKGMEEEDAINDVVLPNLNIVLPNNFPGAAEGQKFNVFYNVYTGAGEVWNTKVVLTNGEYVLQE